MNVSFSGISKSSIPSLNQLKSLNVDEIISLAEGNTSFTNTAGKANAETITKAGMKWVGNGATEVKPGHWVSADGTRRFRNAEFKKSSGHIQANFETRVDLTKSWNNPINSYGQPNLHISLEN